ncbi:hypothetical protein KEX41_02250 [Burkholderia thailandensis]|uniref:hypothetical protein n=1 Tax=Burkholderia thailandensis TaxID=57975 RepID=UPI00192DDB14|nr:hypothetical protein [Burkholderia thailandensis]MBS2127074.1 hypothetical protein [Burkholderia thailandensis]QRA12475.1 hypothetical protein JMY07_08050 [Burkholderia thailandensis]
MKIWQSVIDEGAGYLFSLSDSLSITETKFPGMLASVADGAMIIASDYSGQHKEATHEAYSFLVTTDLALNEWLPLLQEFRERWLPDGRRISFKKLNEPVRWRALPAFLEAAGKLSGNLITVLIDRRVGSFIDGGSESALAVFPDCFPPHTKYGTVEKMLRLASFVALIISGLRREDQHSVWISDHDETLDSHEKREGFARLATYLTFGLTGWRNAADHLFGTTESPTAPYWSEDVAALADLAAGAYCQMSNHLPAFLGKETWQVLLASGDVESQRARTIGDWLATGNPALKHVLLRLEPDDRGEIRSSAQAFSGKIHYFFEEPSTDQPST